MKFTASGLLIALLAVMSPGIVTPAIAKEQTTAFCKILSMETDLHWTYFTLPKACFKEERFQIRSDGNNNMNALAHLFAAHAGGLEVSITWDVHGFGPIVLGIKTRPPS